MPVFSKIADYYGLGAIQGKPKALDGGRSHLLWRMDTTGGCFVVKQMLPRFEKEVNVDLCRHTQAIAKLVAKHGLPAVTALVNRDCDICFIENKVVYMVFPYVNALRLSRSKMAIEQCTIGGDCLARLHGLALDVPSAPQWQFHFHSEYLDYIENLKQIKPKLATELWSMLDTIKHCYRVAAQYHALVPQNIVVSHRDLDTYNFIWDTQGNYYIVDWDTAGQVDAATELMYVAITWGMERYDYLNMDKVIALFKAYQKRRPLEIKDRLALLDTVLVNWMNWMFKQLRRLATQSLTLAEQNAAISEIHNSVLSFSHVQSGKSDPWFCHK